MSFDLSVEELESKMDEYADAKHATHTTYVKSLLNTKVDTHVATLNPVENYESMFISNFLVAMESVTSPTAKKLIVGKNSSDEPVYSLSA